MLQQTQVATVIDYYQRFMNSFPDVNALAAAEVADVLKHWEGLGYYRRARQLHAAAQVIVEQHGGKFPETFAEVLALPGIGRYTAGAILSISLDRRLPILEGNTIRVFARLMALRTDPRSSANQKRLWAFSESLLPQKRCGDFNQALMELGSEICTPRQPQCLICSVRDWCPTGQQGLHELIPASSKKIKYEDLHEAVIIVARRGKYLVRQCAPGERWQGLWDFPRFEIARSKPAAGRNAKQLAIPELIDQLKQTTGLKAALVITDHRIKHAVTKYRITLDCYQAESVTGHLKSPRENQLQWVSAAQLDTLPMSVTGRKVASSSLIV